MSYRTRDEKDRSAIAVERAQDALTLRVLSCVTASAARQVMADALLLRIAVTQGEDGTLRVVA
jgi:hypothetical protein